MSDTFTWATAFLAGLAGSIHCVGMCGGIASALAISSGAESSWSSLLRILLYNLGRVASYAMAGGLVAGLGTLLSQLLPYSITGPGLRVVLGLLMIAIGAQLAFKWPGLEPLTRVGASLWGRLAPFAGKLMRSSNPVAPLLLGALWGWLPCGLVYAILVAALLTGSALHGATTMFLFGLGTLPAMLLTGLMARQFATRIASHQLRRMAGVTIIIFGLWTVSGPVLIHLLSLSVPKDAFGCNH